MTSLRKYIRKIDESVLGFINNGKKPKTLKRHAQIGESDEQVGLYDTDQDRWSRHAKRHFSKADLQNVMAEQCLEFDLNESVTYLGKQAVVRIPNGPNNTVGIMMEGRMRMVQRSDVTKLEEGVMGSMTELAPLNRVMQLAGIAGAYNTTGTQDQFIVEDETDTFFTNLSRENLSHVNQNAECARLYTVGQLLMAISKQLDPNSYDSTAIKTALSKQNLVNTLGPLGASFIKQAEELSNSLKGQP